MSFGYRMKVAVKGKQMSYLDLSDASGIAVRTIAGYARGERTPKWESAVKIAEALGVSLDWLCGRSGPWDNPYIPEKAPVGKILRAVRKIRKLSRADAIEEYGFSEYALQSIESGRSASAFLVNIICMADALNISLDWLREMEAEHEE